MLSVCVGVCIDDDNPSLTEIRAGLIIGILAKYYVVFMKVIALN